MANLRSQGVSIYILDSVSLWRWRFIFQPDRCLARDSDIVFVRERRVFTLIAVVVIATHARALRDCLYCNVSMHAC